MSLPADVSLDCCIIGGGIIGLSIARELAGRGHRVRVLARERRRETASWAAAGIFPPAPEPVDIAAEPNAALTAFSDRLHREWARELRDETGIDNGLGACGGLHLAADEARLEALRPEVAAWRSRGARCEWLAAGDVAEAEPALAGAVAAGRVVGGFLLPDEMRIRPPRHLEALEASCLARGVVIEHEAAVTRIEVDAGRVHGLSIDSPRGRETVVADRYVLAAGAWTGDLAAGLGLAIETRPIRGQIALLRLPGQVLGRVVNLGLDYLVPREDGRILAGSTLEDAGFDASTVPAEIDRLLAVAADLLGDLSMATVEKTWAGLRPGSTDGLPSIGLAPACDNAIVAGGHFRAGLHQSTGTAVIVADLVEGHLLPLDIAAFAPDRSPGPAGPESVATYLVRAAKARSRGP
ncbi:MAG: NAD(P)/FAD-dependent oxidoreductase [Planctomycetota bacterium]